MSNVALRQSALAPMPADAVDRVRELETAMRAMPQIEVPTEHVIHGGMYFRTIRLPAGVVLTGALVKIPTTVIVSGSCWAYVGHGSIEIDGYAVLPGSPGRKQVFTTRAPTVITMAFPTNARNIGEAEAEFTDECALLVSRNRDDLNVVTITGE